MPRNLKRHTGQGDLHFITFACYEHRKFLASASSRNIALEVLGEVREHFRFALVGYVVMPDHVHLLMSEPEVCPPAKAIQVFKQRVSRKLRQSPFSASENTTAPLRFWQRRYYDFNVYSHHKLQEKLDYVHANPVIEGLVSDPNDWPWSSWTAHSGRPALLQIDSIK